MFIIPCSSKGTADLHRGYFWYSVTLMMLTAIAFPHHRHCKGHTKWEGCVSRACPSRHSLIWPQALRLMRPKHQHRVIISTKEALNFFTPCLWGHCCSKADKVQRERGQRVGFCPQSMQTDFSSSPVSWWMQFLHTLGELINYKAGWVSKVNDLIIFPASLLRSQLSGSGKWGCGPLWCLRAVWVCVLYVCVSVCPFT